MMRSVWSEEWLAKDEREAEVWTMLGVLSAFLLSSIWVVWVVLRWSVGR